MRQRQGGGLAGLWVVCGGALILHIGGRGVGAARLRGEPRHALHAAVEFSTPFEKVGGSSGHVLEVLPEARLRGSREIFRHRQDHLDLLHHRLGRGDG